MPALLVAGLVAAGAAAAAPGRRANHPPAPGTGAASEGVGDVQWTFRLNVGYAW